MIVLGMTGSIGMGKSTTAKMFADLGIPVHDADATVHRLYAGEAVPVVEALFPGTTANGKVDREKLAAKVLNNPEAIRKLEAAIHPLVHAAETQFREKAVADGADIVLLDIPLLFETGGEHRVDAVVVVTTTAQIQRERVLDRPGMTEEKFEAILSRQVPDAIKREKADFIVDTSDGIEHARAQVEMIVAAIRSGNWTKFPG